jgi:hypothetical protein
VAARHYHHLAGVAEHDEAGATSEAINAILALPVTKETRSLTTDAWFLWNTALATTLSYGGGGRRRRPCMPKRTWAFNIKLCM